VVVLVKDRHELEAGKRPAHIQFCDVSVQPAEYSGIVATDEEDFVPLQNGVGVDGIYQHLLRGDEDVECILLQGDCWVQFYFHERIWAALRI
jgi:hypothetical protein